MATQTLALHAKLVGLEKVTRDLAKGASSWTSKLSQMTIIAQGVATAVKAVMGPVVEQIKIAAKFRISIDQTAAAVDAMGQDGEKTARSMVAWTDAMALATGQSQDAIFEVGRLALTMEGGTEHTKELTQAAMAMEAAGLAPANTALKALTRSLQGDRGALARYGIATKDMTKAQLEAGGAIDLVNKQMLPQLNAKLKSTGGQYERLTNIIGDRYLEAVGMAIADNDRYAASLDYIGTELAAVAPGVDGMKSGFQTITMVLAGAVSSMLSWGATVTSFVGSMASGIGDLTSMLLESIAKPFRLGIELGELIAEKIGLPADVVETYSLIGDTLDQATGAAREFGNSIKFAGDDAAAGMKKASEIIDGALVVMRQFDQKAWDAAHAVEAIGRKADEAVGQVLELASPFADMGEFDIDALDASTVMFLDKRFAMYDADAERANESAARIMAYQDDIAAKAKEVSDKAAAENQAIISSVAGYATAAATKIATTFKAVRDGSLSAQEAVQGLAASMASAIIDAVVRSIQAYAIQAAAAAYAGNVGIPVVGLAVGAAAAGVAGALVKAMLSDVKGFAQGGVVQGPPGVDNVMVWASPGEEIRTPQQQQATVTPQDGAGLTFHIHAPLGMGDSTTVVRELDRALIPALRDAYALGRLDFLKGGA